MSHTAAQGDALGMIALVAWVDAVAVSLKDALPVVGILAEGLLKILPTSARLPPVTDAAV